MTITVALDAMGGDFGPCVVVPGLKVALTNLKKEGEKQGDVRFLLFGNTELINPYLDCSLGNVCEIVHSDVAVTNEMKPLEALRHKRDSNLGMAIQAVADGRADAVVSAANTGAYITLATVILGTLDLIDRPAIPAIMPNRHGRSVVLDLGANLECPPERLAQFSLMGEALARVLLKKESPTVGLLNVGSEEMKGHAVVQAAGQIMHLLDTKTVKGQHFSFHGFIEGDDIFKGVTDVVVTDGFSGNLTLKGIEGAIRFCFYLLKEALGHSVLGRLATVLATPVLYPILRKVKKVIDPRLYNGAVFLGLRKIAVKSHGGADAFAFSQAIKVAVQTAQSNFCDDIEKRLHLLKEIQ